MNSQLLFVVNFPIFLCPVRFALPFLCKTKLSHISILCWENEFWMLALVLGLTPGGG